jgi:hypothetical protein
MQPVLALLRLRLRSPAKAAMEAEDHMSSKSASQTKIRYAVVGLGHLAQVAIIPAFTHAENSELVALVTGDPTKQKGTQQEAWSRSCLLLRAVR